MFEVSQPFQDVAEGPRRKRLRLDACATNQLGYSPIQQAVSQLRHNGPNNLTLNLQHQQITPVLQQTNGGERMSYQQPHTTFATAGETDHMDFEHKAHDGLATALIARGRRRCNGEAEDDDWSGATTPDTSAEAPAANHDSGILDHMYMFKMYGPWPAYDQDPEGLQQYLMFCSHFT